MRISPNDTARRDGKIFSWSGTHSIYDYLFAVLAARRVETLDEIGGVSEEESVAGGAADHR